MNTPSASGTQRSRIIRVLPIALAVVYGGWLTWLGYVAWVNVQAGNQ